MSTKTFKCWRIIYALVAQTPDEIVIAEVGSSEKPFEQLLARLQSARPAKPNTKMGRYLAEVHKFAAPCFLWQLESCYGDLDYADGTKELWVICGKAAGIVFPQRSYPIELLYKISTTDRAWPDFRDIASAGVRIR